MIPRHVNYYRFVKKYQELLKYTSHEKSRVLQRGIPFTPILYILCCMDIIHYTFEGVGFKH